MADTKPSNNEKNTGDYKQNFAVLKDIAERLQNEDNVDIDELVAMVEKATNAFQHCKGRIDAVEKVLADKLNKQDG